MNTFQSIIFVTITGNAIVGLLVWLSNPERKLNRYFLLTTFLITNWLSCMFAITFQTAENLLFWTRQVSAAAVFLPVGFFILQSVISSPEITLKSLLYKIRYLLIAAITVAVMCQTKSFVTTTYFSNPSETVPLSEYGTTFIIYILYFCAMVIGMMVSIRQTFINSSGVQRIESQFLLLGWLFSFSFGLILYTVSIIAGRQEVTRFLPLFAFVMDGFVAYGIATRRILAVSVVVQRFVAYILLAVYLILTYMATEWLIDVGFHYVIPDTSYLSHLAAALAVAFSMIPANNWMHRFSYRLFSSSNPFDMDRVLTESEVILQEVSTESTLLAAFSDFITHTFRTTEITLLEKNDDDSFSERCSFPNQHRRKQISLKPFSSLIQLINRDRESFTVDTLERMRATPLVINARSEMKEAGATVAIGCFLHKKLQMIVLLHRKTNGAIYDLREQQTLQRLCNQLAVALENARLYTAVQDGKIYNEILLDSLTSGIIAINESRKVMVFNQR
ncbi:MAG: hypothetical protein JXR40_00490, partial [Pontiellaceae bacterium]|nr:hypothetical protein [Pontiellaceae bacterium]